MKIKQNLLPFLAGALASAVLTLAYSNQKENDALRRIELKEANFIVVDDETGDVLDEVSFGISYMHSDVDEPSQNLPAQLQGPKENEPQRRVIWADLERDPRYVKLSKEGYETEFLETGVMTYASQGGGPIPSPIIIRLKKSNKAG
jgi:hypothetical protein